MEDERYLKDEAELGHLTGRIRDLYNLYKEFKIKYKDESKHPEHIFLKDPDLQRKFREEFADKISEIPNQRPIRLYPDTLLTEFLCLKLDSKPESCIRLLSEFYYTQTTHIKNFKLKFLQN